MLVDERGGGQQMVPHGRELRVGVLRELLGDRLERVVVGQRHVRRVELEDGARAPVAERVLGVEKPEMPGVPPSI